MKTVDEMTKALVEAGWIRSHSSAHIWRSPNNALHRGPALAYHIMMGLPWPPVPSMAVAQALLEKHPTAEFREGE